MKKKFYNTFKVLQRPFFTFFKKHFCPICNSSLTVVKRNEKVDNVHEFHDQEMLSGFSFDLIGPINIIYNVFKCENCEKEFKIREIHKLYRDNKKAR